MAKGPISEFIVKHYKHFNAAALVDGAQAYETHLIKGGKMMITLAGSMSTAELGKSLAEMILISCSLFKILQYATNVSMIFYKSLNL